MQRAFQAKAGGSTRRLTAGTGSSNISLGICNTDDVFRIYNAGSAIAYVAFGDSTVTATVPTAGTGTGGTAGSFPCGSGITEVQAAASSDAGSTALYIAAITSSSTADLYATPGNGI